MTAIDPDVSQWDARRPDEVAVPRLESDRRRWLRDALARVHPGHEWLDAV